jgi:hypothetical protein
MRADRQRRLGVALHVGPEVAGLVDLGNHTDLAEELLEKGAGAAPLRPPADAARPVAAAGTAIELT